MIGENRKFNLFNRGLAIACLNINSLTVEISKPHSRAFLVSTWYKPPNSLPICLTTLKI